MRVQIEFCYIYSVSSPPTHTPSKQTLFGNYLRKTMIEFLKTVVLILGTDILTKTIVYQIVGILMDIMVDNGEIR